MISDELEKEATKLEKYLIRQGRSELIAELKNLNELQLKDRIMKQALYRQEILDAKTNDEELQRVKKQKSELESPYSQNLRMNDKIARFISLLLKEK